jgi:hypothetical protein
LLGAALAATAPIHAAAQSFPSRPITLIVPFPAGGSTDAMNRILAEKLQEQLGQPVVLDFKPGAGGNLGTEIAARAKPDGHTLVFVAMPQIIGRSIYPRLGYDLLKDLEAVGSFLETTPVLIVNAHLGERFFQRVFAGRAGECFGDPSLPHAFTYGPDVARALAVLGARPEAPGRVWHLPTGEAVSMNDWAAALGRALSREVRVTALPGWVVRAAGWFVPMMRELGEMRYQWQEPYRVDDGDVRRSFGLEPTDFDAQVRATADWAQRTYGRA